MIIVADSGSTSIDWRIIKRNGETIDIKTEGVNPVYQDVNAVAEIFESVFGKYAEGASKVYFYGAGVMSERAYTVISDAIKRYIPDAQITIDSDLVAAGIALYGDEEGLVGILGTGSNVGLYREGKIVKSIPSGGFILGDEGSGAYLGKQLLNAYLKGKLPKSISDEMESRYGLTYQLIVENVYRSPMPSRYLASFVPFIKEHIDDAGIYKMVYDSIKLYFINNNGVFSLARRLGFIGSIAVEFRKIIDEIANEFFFDEVKICRSAIDGLAEYYKKQNA